MENLSPDPRFLGRPVLLAMISCHVTGLFFLPLMPLLLGALAQDFSVSSLGLGIIGSVQLGCTAVGAIFLSRQGRCYSCRTLAIYAITIELLVNTGCVLSDSFTTVTVLRGVSGIAQGMLLAAASAGAAISHKTERFFVHYNVTLAIFAVAGLVVGAWVISDFGHAGGFALFAVVDFIGLALIYRGFPRFRIELAPRHSEAVPKSLTNTNLKIGFALILFGAALGGTQTFIERLGEWHGGSFQTIGNGLAAGWCLAIGAPFLILPMVRRWGGVTSLVVAYLLVIVSALALSATATLPYFLIAAAFFTPAALFVEPLLFGLLGVIDRTGRMAALGPAALSIGSGIGPAIAGVVVKFWGLSSIGVLAGSLLSLSFVCLLPLALNYYRIRSV